MRKRLAITLAVLAALLFSWSAQADFEDFMLTGVIVNCKQYVTLRSRPSTRASELEKVYRGEYVTLLSRTVYRDGDNYFVLVETDRQVGYVLITYIDAIIPDLRELQRDTYGIGYGTVTATDTTVDLILRSGPGVEYTALGYLFGGEVLPSLGRAEVDEGGRLWYCCVLDDTVCWISSKYTTLRRP